MSNKNRNTINSKARDIDAGLSGLFDVLGQAIGDIASKLEDGKTGAISRDHVFETAKGPMRAHAGIHLRMGGLDSEQSSTSKPQPVNHASRTKSAATPDANVTPKPMPLSHDLFEDNGAWVLTADMPGVSRKDLTLSRNGADLVLETAGLRQYHAQIALSEDFVLDEISVTLRNGILALKIPKVAS